MATFPDDYVPVMVLPSELALVEQALRHSPVRGRVGRSGDGGGYVGQVYDGRSHSVDQAPTHRYARVTAVNETKEGFVDWVEVVWDDANAEWDVKTNGVNETTHGQAYIGTLDAARVAVDQVLLFRKSHQVLQHDDDTKFAWESLQIGRLVKWGKCTTNWIKDTLQPYVLANPCDDAAGANPDTGTELTILLPRPAKGSGSVTGQDPNVVSTDVIAYVQTASEELVCVSSYLDAKIGTVVMWALDDAEIAPGWELYDEMEGRFPVGVNDNHADPITSDPDPWNLGTTGGTESHEHDNHWHTIAICGTCVNNDPSIFSVRLFEPSVTLIGGEHPTSIEDYTLGGANPAGTGRENHVNPFVALYFIIRVDNSSPAP